MFKCFSWLIAVVVLCVVLCGLFHDGCRHAVFTDTVGGVLVGLVHGRLTFTASKNCPVGGSRSPQAG